MKIIQFLNKYLFVFVFGTMALIAFANVALALKSETVPSETVGAIPYTVAVGSGTGGGSFKTASTSLSYDGTTLVVSTTVSSTNVTVSASGTCSNCAPKIFIAEEIKNASAGGTSIAGSNARILNTVLANTITGATLSSTSSSSTITLPPGTYRLEASAPAFIADKHQAFWYDTTNNTTTLSGTSEYTDAATNVVQTRSWVIGRFTASATTTYQLRHYIQTSRATNGLGVTTGYASTTDVYAQVKIEKE